MSRAPAGPARPRVGPGGARPRPAGHPDRAVRPGSAGRRGGRDRGSATAELAVGLPALLMLLLAGLTAVGAVTTQLQCVDAARDAVLAASRGASGVEAGQRAAPAGAELTVTRSGDTVTATVRAPVPLLGGHLPGMRVTATAVAAAEPGAPEPGAPEPGPPEPGALERGAPEPGALERGAPEPGAVGPVW